MARKKAVTARRSGTKKETTVVQEALQTTFILKGTLKRVQLMYLRVGELLLHVRDKKLYEALKHPDMESYAQERLGLGRTSLFDYIRIREWVEDRHPEWLADKHKGFIPDLADVGDLIWIESELARTNLPAAKRKELEALLKSGLTGSLRREDVRNARGSRNTVKSGLQNLISSLRSIKKRASRLSSMSPEVLSHLDAAIQILLQDKALSVAQLDSSDIIHKSKWTQKYLS